MGADEFQFVGGFGAIGVVGVDEGVALHGRGPWKQGAGSKEQGVRILAPCVRHMVNI
jgi:hypothetical protein